MWTDICSFKLQIVSRSVKNVLTMTDTILPGTNIIVDDLCTYDNLKCHSFRRDNENSGRMTMIAYRGLFLIDKKGIIFFIIDNDEVNVDLIAHYNFFY